MTEEQRLTLLNKFIEEPKVSVDTTIPQSLVSSGEDTLDVASDESKLTYDELLEEYIRFNKSAIMKPATFDRLWN
jgi:hypothetical protein